MTIERMTKHGLKTALTISLLLAGSLQSQAAAKSVAYIPGFFGNSFYNLLGSGIEAEAKTRGWSYTTQGSSTAFTAAAQTPIVNAICGKHPDVLIIAPTDAVAMRRPFRNASMPASRSCLSTRH